MRQVKVKSHSELTDCPVGAIIGIEGTELVFEVSRRENRGGEFVDFVDKDGKICRLYVKEFGKLPYGIIENRRW